MSFRFSLTGLWGWLAVGTASAVVALTLYAAEAGSQGAPGDAEAGSAAKSKQADPFQVPEGSPEELLKFLAGLQKVRPQSTDAEGMAEFRTKIGRAFLTAAERILGAKATEEQAAQAVQAKVVGLAVLQQTGDKDAGTQLANFPAELERAGRSKGLVRQARSMLLQIRVGQARQAEPKEIEKLIAEVQQYLSAGPIEPQDVQLAMGLGNVAERLGQLDLAANAYRSFGEALGAAKDKRIGALGAKLAGAARRLSIVGKPLEIEGRTVDGKPFDWSQYKGKVVLVDFWATWCGPCLVEMDNIRQNYEAYHDRGFDVVGISLDEDLDALKAYLKEKKTPWTILVNEEAKEGEPDNSMATRYGIFAIPALFLVGPDGKVISTKARGPELGRELARLLGPADANTKKSSADKD